MLATTAVGMDTTNTLSKRGLHHQAGVDTTVEMEDIAIVHLPLVRAGITNVFLKVLKSILIGLYQLSVLLNRSKTTNLGIKRNI